MTLVVLIILAVIWAAVLVPPFLQSRSESRPADSISSFRNQLSVLERRAGGSTPVRTGPVRPMGMNIAGVQGLRPADRARIARAEQRKRRRDILFTLVAAAGITLVLGLVAAAVLVLHLLVDGLLGAYVFLLVRAERLRQERATKVRPLRPVASRRREVPAYRPELALRRTAN